MNSTYQIYREFDSFYIVLSETLDHIALCDQCECLKVAYIACNVYCEHPTDYRSHCTCDTVRLILNTTPPLQGFYLETSRALLMPSQCMTWISNLSVCHQRLVDHLQLSANNMHPCHECVLRYLMCCISKESNKCLKCVCSTHHKCDLVISEAEWVCVNYEATHLWTKLQETLLKINHLHKQYNLIQSHKSDMIYYEFQNIKKLKTDEAMRASETSTVSSLNKFLLNISSNQVKIPANFDS